MKEMQRIVIPAKNVRSLCWHGEELVDWVGGGNRYCLNGSTIRRYVNYPYRFNRSVVSPDGQYAVIYEVLGTKGLVLKEGKIIREINRSYYLAHVYEYPIVLFRLANGRTVLAHCPEEYNKLEIEDVETGECLTARSNKTMDFFHSRLQVSSNGKYLMSAGWVWHPFDTVLMFEIEQVMHHPELLDQDLKWNFASTELHDAAFAGGDAIVISSADTYYEDEDERAEETGEFMLQPDQIGRYSLTNHAYQTIAPLKAPTGLMMSFGDYVVGFYEHPKLIDLATGDIIVRWPDLATGNQNGSIISHLDKIPPIALDPTNKRFAVADAENITVIQLGSIDAVK